LAASHPLLQRQGAALGRAADPPAVREVAAPHDAVDEARDERRELLRPRLAEGRLGERGRRDDERADENERRKTDTTHRLDKDDAALEELVRFAGHVCSSGTAARRRAFAAANS